MSHFYPFEESLLAKSRTDNDCVEDARKAIADGKMVICDYLLSFIPVQINNFRSNIFTT